MKHTKLLTLSILTGTLLFNGCINVPQQNGMSNAQKEAMMNAMMQRTQNMNQSQQMKSQNLPKIETITESALVGKVSQYPMSKKGVKFEKMRDGFAINGNEVYLDPEGEISNYGYNWKNGTFLYLLKLSPSEYKIKFNRVDSNKESLDIAYVRKQGSLFAVETVTGKKIRAKGLILTSTGFIATRDSSAFIYTIGEGTKKFVAPKGWHIASFQNGDIATTKFILLERDVVAEDKKVGTLGNLFSSVKELGNVLGMTKIDDFMLMSIDNPNKKYLLNITLGDKEVATYSGCQQSGSFTQKCSNMETKESLYQPDGLKNFTHYFWTVNWFQGQKTIYSITKESTNKRVLIRDLNTGKTVEAAYRVTGFNSFTATQDTTGIVKLHIDGGLLKGVDIENVEEFLAKEPAISVEKE